MGKNLTIMNKVKLDEVDHQILDILIDNTRVPFTDISKRLFISAGTVHVRVKKMEEAGIIKGSSLNLDYVKLGYSFIAYIGIFLEKTKIINVQDRPGHDFRYALNSSKIRKLRWKPKTNIHDGLKKTFEWYLNNKNYYRLFLAFLFKIYSVILKELS